MYRIAGKRIDFLDDPKLASSAEFRALTDVHLHAAKHHDLPDMDFALVLQGVDRHPKFPIYNKVAASISITDFSEHAEDIHPFFRAVAATFLKKAADYYGLVATDALREYSVEGVVDNRINLRQMADDTLVERMDKVARLERMEQFWLNNERTMTLEELNDKADRVVKLASEVASQVHPRIWEYATKSQVGPRFKAAILQRTKVANQLNKPEAAVEFEEAVKGLKTAKDAVSVLRTLDEKHGMRQYYGSMTDPYMAAYGGQVQQKHATETGLRYKLETLAAQSDHELHGVLSDEGLRRFRLDPVGTFHDLPQVAQDYIMAKFDHELKEEKDQMLRNHESEASIKKRVKNLRSGKREYEDVYKVTDKEKRPKYPTSASVPVGKAQKVSPAKHTPQGTGSMSVASKE